jgi:hypothetical protein
MVKASEALKQRHAKPAKLNPTGAPIRASELQRRRHEQALRDLEKAIERREKAFEALMRAHSKVWAVGRVIKRYEKLK